MANSDYTIEFRKYVEKSKDGTMDLEATIAKFKVDLDTFVTLQERDQGALLAAIEEVYAENPGANMNGPAIRTLALAKVGFTAANFQALSERCAEVMKNEPRYYTVKGKGGGTARMSDDELQVFIDTSKTPHDLIKDAIEKKKADKKAAK